MSRKIECPIEGYEDVAIYLPDKWLGKHMLLREDIEKAVEDRADLQENPLLINLAISLAMVDKLENIPGLEGDDISNWSITDVPLEIIMWLPGFVMGDFNKALQIPKGVLDQFTTQ